MTPEDLRSQRFTTRLFGGVSAEEVAAFLEDVAEAFEDVQQTNALLAARADELEAALRSRPTPVEAPAAEPVAGSRLEGLRAAALQEVEALLRDARAQAQTILESASERDAAARREAEALVADAREQEAAIRSEIDRLTQSHLKLVDDVRKTLDTCHEWLVAVDPRGRARGRRETLEQAARGGNGISPDAASA